MLLSAPPVSTMGELAQTQGDAQSHSTFFRSRFQYFLFTSSQFFFPPSFSLTLGPNELCSLVVIGSQMCCHIAAANAVPWYVMQTHMITHGQAMPAHQNYNDGQGLFQPPLTCPDTKYPILSHILPAFFLYSPHYPASSLKLRSVGPYVLHRDP